MRHFCALFDRNYQYHAKLLYTSLERNHSDFRLFLFCMDTDSYEYFRNQDLPKAELITLGQLELSLPELKRAKANRKPVEYFFTCTPAICTYVLKHYDFVSEIVYLDADIYFFSDPEIIFKEVGKSSVSIIAHRFRGFNRLRNIYGHYNVGWISFKRDDEGQQCLGKWFNDCLDWCYDRLTVRRYADQKYLDRWPATYCNLAVIKNPGANVAPWNVGNYRLSRVGQTILVDGSPLVFYHFAGLKKIKDTFYTTCSAYFFPLDYILRNCIYGSYLTNLQREGYSPKVNLRYKRKLVRPFFRFIYHDKVRMQDIGSPRRVMFIYKFLPQYRVDFFHQLKAELWEKGVELRIIYGKSKNKDALKKDEVEIEWAKYVPNKTFRIGNLELIWQPCTRYLKDIDLVIVQPENKLLLNYYLMFARHFFRYRLGFWGHGRNMQAKANSLRNRFKSLHLSNCDWWFAYTSGVKEVVQKRHFDQAKITVVQNAIDTMSLKKQYAAVGENTLNELRKELGIYGDQVGIYCGGIYPEKRINFILDACLAIKKQLPDFHMIFIGAGVDSEKITQLAAENKWIHYLGPKFGKDRVQYFKLAAIQIMPGLVGLGILDSFALETPIVTTDFPFHSPEIDYLENGVNGIMTADDFNVYTNTVVDLLKTKKYEELINGCRLSSQKYTIEAMVQNFKNGILSCLQQ